MRIVVLEGPDGSGKSTLAQRLHEYFGWAIVHLGPPPDNMTAFTQCEKVIQALVDAKEKGVILDRFHIGERIYGPVMRGVDTMKVVGQRLIERRMALKHNTVLVDCLPSWDVCRSNWLARKGEEYVKDEAKMKYIYAEYKGFETRLPRLHYDYTTDDPAATVATVKRMLA